ncbi:asparagine--tRNA ligase [Puniceicoccales bacterium CK1056]|uniref:Asparagine--tRNA ligase n=1 Tax=Oceanipulchritudo coccoides TaxID=2706888 RepID=A0A6B2M4D6_9BACT|nr:asparagine--tRNA ligase [Oceanipulchritudo coccoides]
MKKLNVKAALGATSAEESVKVSGWVRTRRDAKGFSFLEINDGTCLANLQAIVDEKCPEFGQIHEFTTGSAVCVQGALVESQGAGQAWEIQASKLELIGKAEDSYPLQKKRHSLEYLREIAHLRPRANLFGAVFRVRSRLAYAVHQFFQEREFIYVHTPLITASDCEGAGEMFRVSTLDPKDPPRTEEGEIDYSKDFFERPTYLTVSGQLEAEIFALSHSKVYTFGPTFRAENSNTSRHASEFWMIEPEVAFCDLEGDMDLAEEFIKYLISDILEHCAGDLEMFGKFVDKGLHERLRFVTERPFERLSYTEAVELLENSGEKFDFPIRYGANLQSEHERYLTEKHFKRPVTVYNYPKEIKPFYMRQNNDDKTVAAMDVLVPGIGEIIGGSQREERLDRLDAAMEHHELSKEDYWWYRDLRRYGSAPHAGFGLGFERMLMFVTGVGNIRDVIPFARTPGNAEF